MADAYLCWKYPDDLRPNNPPVNPGGVQDPPPSPQSPAPTNDFTTTTPSDTTSDHSSPQAQGSGHDNSKTEIPSPSTSTEVEILVINIYTLSTSIKIPCAGDETTASTLAGLGFIGNAPFNPSVVISIKTLELYRILRRRKPSFSVEAFVKVISDLYMVRLSFVTHHLSSLRKRPHIAPSTVGCSRMHLTHT